MDMHIKRLSALVLLSLLLASCGRGPAAVDSARLMHADDEPGNWMSHGRTYSEQRFSPLTKINAGNVKDLGLAWSFDLDTHRGQESTPLVIDGVMYATTAWSKVKALDAASGKLIWDYDPKVPGGWGVKACCDVVNRGLAAWKGKLYLGTLDGRLIALDARTGKPVWQADTIDRSKSYTITGAPRVVKGLVIIGNGGAELGVRGYVTAYDANTGKQVWRFYTVPGDPSKGFENKAMAMAAKTWHGQWWKLGGGGTAWDAIVYDPQTDLLFVGAGNGSPWDAAIRSPGGGDNLFLSSIVALKPETGEYVWHYQETPGESWDYTATQPIIVADLVIDGAKRHVVMQAPKSGFFYVLDAKTGALISAKPYGPANWASGIDMKTGRPIENPDARFGTTGRQWLARPGPAGFHNWQPMAFNPATGLVYLPRQEIDSIYTHDASFTPSPIGANLGLDYGAPTAPAAQQQILKTLGGALIAWDPVKQQERWRIDDRMPSNGGVLTTAGNLVVEGLASGEIAVYRADTGAKLWSFAAQTGVMAGPVSYSVHGEQYIAVTAGWGGSLGLIAGKDMTNLLGIAGRNISRVLAFKLGGTAKLPPVPAETAQTLDPPAQAGDEASIARGSTLFAHYCTWCHGANATASALVPDLRYSAHLKDESWYGIVLGGALEDGGMASFAPALSREDATAIRNYVVKEAHDAAAQPAQTPASTANAP